MNKTTCACVGLFVVMSMLCGCEKGTSVRNTDPLSNWRDGENKNLILEYVNRVCSDGGGFVPIKDRIAVFDVDGTIGCEIPLSIDIAVAVFELCHAAETETELRYKQPWKAAYNWVNDRHGTDTQYILNHMDDVKTCAFRGRTAHYYEQAIRDVLDQTNIDWDVKYGQLMYLPMVELIEYLVINDFQVFLVSGSSVPCLRAIIDVAINPYIEAPDGAMCGDHVIGSSVDMDFVCKCDDGSSFIMGERSSEYPVNVGQAKPINIFLQIGKQPILAFGNSMGDKEMLEYTKSMYAGEPRKYPTLELLLVHDDPGRESEYRDADLEELAEQWGWRLVSMKRDFGAVFCR